MKLYDEDGNEVEAFTQKEVDAKLKEASTETSTKLKEAEDALKAKTSEYDDLSKKYDDKKNSYTELQKKNTEDEKKYKDVIERDTKKYNDTIEAKIKEVAGDDKEYAAELKKQLEGGVGSETDDAATIDKQISKAKALASIELSREVNSPADGGGSAPAPKNQETNFTETAEGKATFDTLSSMMGLPADVVDDKK